MRTYGKKNKCIHLEVDVEIQNKGPEFPQHKEIQKKQLVALFNVWLWLINSHAVEVLVQSTLEIVKIVGNDYPKVK